MQNTDDPRIGVTHNRALCCECGQLRLVSANGGYRPPQWVGEGMSDSEIASWGYDPAHVEPWQRATGALKCENCGVKTTHAVLRDCCKNPAHRDICEQRMGSVHATAESPERALRRGGVRIFELDEPLEEKGLYIRDCQVLLVDGRLDAHDRDDLFEQTLKLVTKGNATDDL